MELDLIKTLASLGVGAIFGLVAFFFYRIDRKSTEKMWRESKKFTEDRLTEIIGRDQETREENTKMMAELKTFISHINGRLK